MKIKKTFQGELPENRIVNTYSDSLTDAYSANYLNGKLSNVVISATEPNDKKDIWVQIGKNLFDKTKIINNLSPTSDGGFTGASGCSTSYVKVNPGDTYMVSSNVERPWVFNFSKDIPSIGVVATPWNIANGNAFQVVVPDGFEYISFRHLPSSPGEDNINQDIQVEQGEFKTDYEPYIPKKIYVKKDSRYELVYDELNNRKEVYVGPTEPKNGEEVWIKPGKNLFNITAAPNTTYYSEPTIEGDTLKTSGASGNFITYLIDVKKNTNYTISVVSKTGSINIYDATVDNYIAGMGSNNTTLTFNSGSYTQISVVFYGAGTYEKPQLEQGSVATNYEKYADKRVFIKNDNGAYEEFGQAFELEEGSWTPGVGNDGGASPTTTYSKRRGYYKKIGKLVFVDFYLEGAITKLNATNNYAAITGLPFPAQSNSYFGQNCLHIGTIYKLVSNNSTEGFTLIIYNKLIRLQAGWGAGAATLQTSDRFIISGSGWYITN